MSVVLPFKNMETISELKEKLKYNCKIIRSSYTVNTVNCGEPWVSGKCPKTGLESPGLSSACFRICELNRE